MSESNSYNSINEIVDTISSKKRILILEDEASMWAIYRHYLKEYDVEIVPRGEEAIELFKSGQHYDLLILDIFIYGGLGGEETYDKIKQIDPDIKAVAISGAISQEDRLKYIEMRFKATLKKPFESGKTLSKLVDDLLNPKIIHHPQ
jgi:two-component system, cell cycle sensor histidine kinase and response regulator CckA